MKLGKNKLSALVGAVLSLGVAGQASADVYGVSYLDIDNLTIDISSLTGAGLFTFSTNQDATLNGASDLSSGAASCGGLFGVSNTCGVLPSLSGTVQNAPGGGVARGENDYTVFGQGADYSNSEAAIVRATLLGDGTTQATAISESNLNAGTSAQANTLVQSNTNLQLNFTVSGTGTFSIEFDADINVQAEVTGGDLGIAQANSSVTVLLQRNGVTIASWAPQGTNAVTACGAGNTCTATETALSLNNSNSSGGALNSTIGTGHYLLEVTGLTDGEYTLALASNTSTDLLRIPVPVPGSLLLMGTGLLLGARATRRNKKAA